ncbi:MAG: hypothetical protein ACRDTC_21540 [Pseudonocardiaceae bacterium]
MQRLAHHDGHVPVFPGSTDKSGAPIVMTDGRVGHAELTIGISRGIDPAEIGDEHTRSSFAPSSAWSMSRRTSSAVDVPSAAARAVRAVRCSSVR